MGRSCGSTAARRVPAVRPTARRAVAAAAALIVATVLGMLAAPAAAYPSFWVTMNAYSANKCTWPTPSTLTKGHVVQTSTANA